MKMTRFKKSLSLTLCIVLIAAMALFTTGCGNNQGANDAGTETVSDSGNVTVENDADVAEDGTADSTEDSAGTGEVVEENNQDAENVETPKEDSNVLGEGETEFIFTVTDVEGNETTFTIHTDKQTVGEALLDLGLIDGDAGAYGLYVKTVNGITLDWDTDGKYWAFYVNGEYGMSGVDTTEIVAGNTYSFKAEK